jgi:hypothetical protein
MATGSKISMPVMALEARLKNYISENLPRINSDIETFAKKAQESLKKSSDVTAFYNDMTSVRSKTMSDLAAARAQFEPTLQKMREAKQRSQDLENALSSVGSRAVDMAKKIGGLFLAMFAFSKIKDAIQGAIDLGHTIEVSSRKLGLSTDTYQRLSYVAKQSGTSIESVGRSFNYMSKEAVKNNDIIGVSTRDVNGQVKDSETLFNELMLRISEIENPTERMAASMKAFGRAGIEVNAITSLGKDRLTELIGETKKYSLTLDKDLVEKLGAVKRMQEQLNSQWAVASGKITAIFAPKVLEFLTFFSQGLQKVGDEMERIDGMSDARVAMAADMEKYLGLIKKNNSFTSDEIKMLEIKKQISTLDTMLQGKRINDEIQGVGKINDLQRERIRLMLELDKLQNPAPSAPSGVDFGDKQQKEFDIPGFSKLSIDMAIDAGNKLYQEQDKAAKDTADMMVKTEQDKWKAIYKAADDNLKLMERNAERYKAIQQNIVSAAMTTNSALFELGRIAVQNARVNAQERKNILTAMAIAEGAAAAVTAIKAGWDTGITLFDKAALAAAGGIQAVASTAAQITSIQSASFARGANYVTNGPQMILVGDNPGGRERVQVTPLSSQNSNGPSGGGEFHLHIHGDNVDSAVVDKIDSVLNRAARTGNLSRFMSLVRSA